MRKEKRKHIYVCVCHWSKENRIRSLCITVRGNKNNCFVSVCKKKTTDNNNNKKIIVQECSQAFNSRKLSSNACFNDKSETFFSRSSSTHRISCNV